MDKFPLIFAFRDLVAGNGFVAGVATEGRALLVDEGDGEFWVFGVQPGGVAGGGSGREAALSEFKNNYLSVLYDIAAEAPSFDAFRAEATDFLSTTCQVDAAAWDAA